MKFNQLGRSMVEMLGVLAIIGVLSVGALSGYSTAMNKYQLNKYTQQTSEIIATVISTISDKYYTISSSQTDVAELLFKLNALPDGAIYKGNTDIATSLETTISLGIRPSEVFLYILISYNKNSTSVDACAATLKILQEYAHHTNNLNDIFIQNPMNYYYRSGKCTSTVTKCLTTMTFTDMMNACKTQFDAYVNGSGVFHLWATFDITK